MKILLAVDGSEYTQRMLALIATHDELVQAGAQYTVLTVVPKVQPRAAAVIPKPNLDHYYAEQAREVLDPVRTFAAQKGWTMEFRHCVGSAAHEIAKLAQRERFDLIVLGSHGHGALAGLVLGSVVTGVLARCTTPVLIVRRPESQA